MVVSAGYATFFQLFKNTTFENSSALIFKNLFCKPLVIPYGEIENSLLVSTTFARIPFYVLWIAHKQGRHGFAVLKNPFWESQLPFPVLREEGSVKYMELATEFVKKATVGVIGQEVGDAAGNVIGGVAKGVAGTVVGGVVEDVANIGAEQGFGLAVDAVLESGDAADAPAKSPPEPKAGKQFELLPNEKVLDSRGCSFGKGITQSAGQCVITNQRLIVCSFTRPAQGILGAGLGIVGQYGGGALGAVAMKAITELGPLMKQDKPLYPVFAARFGEIAEVDPWRFGLNTGVSIFTPDSNRFCIWLGLARKRNAWMALLHSAREAAFQQTVSKSPALSNQAGQQVVAAAPSGGTSAPAPSKAGLGWIAAGAVGVIALLGLVVVAILMMPHVPEPILTEELNEKAWVALSPDGKTFAVPDSAVITLYDAATGAAVGKIEGESETEFFEYTTLDDWSRITYSEDGRYLAVSDYAIISVRDGETGEELRQVEPILDKYFDLLEFSKDGRYLAGVYLDKLAVWEVATGKTVASLTLDPKGYSSQIVDLQFSPDGTLAAAATRGGYVHVIRIDAGEELLAVEACGGNDLLSVDFSTDGSRLFVASEDGINRGDPPLVKVLSTDSGDEVFSIDAFEDDLYCARVSPQGNLLAMLGSEGDEKQLKICDPSTGRKLSQHAIALRRVSGAVRLQFSTDEQRLMLSTGDVIMVWDVTDLLPK